MKTSTITNIEEIRRRAREHLAEGAVTAEYRGHRESVIAMLNEALATEMVCVMRYMRHYYMATGLESPGVAEEFKEHAKEESEHARWLAERIVELNGEPNLDPKGLADRSQTEYAPGADTVDMIKENLVAERIVIQSYTAMIRYIGDNDPTSRRVLERIVEAEQKHALDLVTLLDPMLKREERQGAPASPRGS